MKTIHLLGLIHLLLLIGGRCALAQGELTPAGPPAPMMKTLQQIEPRTDVQRLAGNSTCLFEISQPGSYYLTANLVGTSNKRGIEIAADNVTLDLNGFEVRGVPDSWQGVYVAGYHENISLRNGTLCQWGTSGVEAGQASRSLFTDLRVSANRGAGLTVGSGCFAQNCVIRSNRTYGILAQYGCSIRDCVSEWNGLEGINTGYAALVRGCQVRNNGADGIGVSWRSTVADTVSCSNMLVGIRVAGCSIVKDCIVSTNRAEGILVSEYCRVIGNVCDRNNYGIRASGLGNRIEENHTARNVTRGFKVDRVDGCNVIVKNSAYNTLGRVGDYNYEIASGNWFGPVILPSGLAVGLGATHPFNHPWANFGDPSPIQ